jgi:cytolysin-activating lysine-acyltransferase
MMFRSRSKVASAAVQEDGMAPAQKPRLEDEAGDELRAAAANGAADLGHISMSPLGSADTGPHAPSGAAQMANGTPEAGSPKPSPDEVRFAIAFARIISVLMRSPHYKHYTLADLEWLVVPPALLGQCITMDVNANGRSTPVAAAFWALVSEDVDKRLSDSETVPIRLRPDEWRSGDILWLVDIVGDTRALPTFLRHLQDNVFKGRAVKMRKEKARP